MPELPEVETQARALRKNVVGLTIKQVWVGWPKSIAKPAASTFKKKIRGKKFAKIRRRGKFLLLDLSGGLTLVTHFRMTGHFRLADLSESASPGKWYLLPTDRFSRIAFKLNKKRVLHFSDIRKFGRLWLVSTKQVESLPGIAALGPEPLAKGFKAKDFIACLRGFSGMVKPTLLNQKCLAGIGNIYADESLFDAGIHPATRIKRLSDAQLTTLFKMIKANLKDGIKHHGSSVGEFINIKGTRGHHGKYLRVYRRAGKSCLAMRSGRKCRGKVKRLIVGGRGTHICPACQKSKK